ncbi:lytic transglycosylase domain-containing protein [Thermovibrio sp.]
MRKLLSLLLLLPISAFGGELKKTVDSESKSLLTCLLGECSFPSVNDLEFKIPWSEPSFQFWLSYYKKKWNRIKLLSQINSFKLYYPMVSKIFEKEGLPKELSLLAIVESNGEPWAVSKVGAAGLWQLMPETARRLGLKVNRFIDERFDVEKSTRAAAKYLKELYRTFKRWDLAIAAYNAGPGTIERRLKVLGDKDFWDLTKLPDETLDYVPKFYAILSVARETGILKRPSKDELIKVKVVSRASLLRVARKLKVPYGELCLFNKQFKRKIVPSGYFVYVPKRLVGNFKVLKFAEKGEFVLYMPKRTVLIRKVAAIFGVSPGLIKELNGLKRNLVYRGEPLIIVKKG